MHNSPRHGEGPQGSQTFDARSYEKVERSLVPFNR